MTWDLGDIEIIASSIRLGINCRVKERKAFFKQ